jgi:hypothetical protein
VTGRGVGSDESTTEAEIRGREVETGGWGGDEGGEWSLDELLYDGPVEYSCVVCWCGRRLRRRVGG